ncbi:MAG: proteasome assembly chaperone family protein [Nitrososphaerota archaeon]|nr:proteasome assembly chaperone family protein [Nitrososphaerota archaeon]MDG6940313.1 proteasome assembly chaperone family protein [Nitrososphaerota archaeon]
MTTFEIIPEDLDLRGCSLIAGFHGIGATGYWTVKYMIQKLGAERVAFVDSEQAPPVAAYSGGKLVTPHELYRTGNIAFLKIDVPVYRESEVAFYRALASWVARAGFVEAALVGGLDAGLRVDRETHRLAHTSNFSPRGPLLQSKPLEDERIIVGPVAVLLNRFQMLGFPACAILSYATTERVDPRAASAAIEVLSGLYGVEVDTSSLIKGAEALEKETFKEEKPETERGGSMYT